MVRWVAAFTGDTEFTTAIDDFTHEHAHEFKEVEDGEYRLEHTELYKKFLEITESKITSFLESKGWSPEAFYRTCREEVERAEKARRNSADSFFVSTLLACSEFPQFINMMKRARGAIKDARESLQMSAEGMRAVVSRDESECSKEERDVVVAAAQEALEFLEENSECRMAELLEAQSRFDTRIMPIVERYSSTLQSIAFN